MKRIRRIVNSIPRDVFLGVMTTDIKPSSPNECLVCRMISPEQYYRWERGYPFRAAASDLGLPMTDMAFLYFAAWQRQAEVEQAIAERLNRLVPAGVSEPSEGARP